MNSQATTAPPRSSSTPVAERTNPLHWFAGAAHARLDGLVGAPAWAMTAGEQAEALTELVRLQARVTELTWRVLAAADRNNVGDEVGSSSTAAWLAQQTRETRARCYAAARGALALDDPELGPLRLAFAEGRVLLEQVLVIVRTLADLDADEVTSEQRAKALAYLIDLAARHDARELAILGRKLFEVVAPGEAERREADALDRAEKRARAKTRFGTRDNHDGTTSGWFTLPTAQAQMLTKALQAFVAPRRIDPTAWVDPTTGKKIPYAAQLGHAFCELIERLPADSLPQAGGVAATINITVSLEQLRTGLGSALLDTDGVMSPGQVRRLACTARLVPAVLDGRSVPLDLGRTRRLFTEAQRRAMEIRDRGCVAQGCERQPAWCEAHHKGRPWSRGGRTDLADGCLLCPFHHGLAHDDRYVTTELADGTFAFRRRTADQQRRRSRPAGRGDHRTGPGAPRIPQQRPGQRVEPPRRT